MEAPWIPAALVPGSNDGLNDKRGGGVATTPFMRHSLKMKQGAQCGMVNERQGQQMAVQKPVSPKYHAEALNHQLIFIDQQKMESPNSMVPKGAETEVSLFRSCTLCVQGSAQKQDVAEPPCRPPSLTLSVHGAREGPTPTAQVSSL